MSKQIKRFYRFATWFFSSIIAAGTMMQCGRAATKYGPPAYNIPNSTEEKVIRTEEKASTDVKSSQEEAGVKTITSSNGKYKISFNQRKDQKG